MTAPSGRIEELARDAKRQTDAEQALRSLTELRGELDALEPSLVARALRGGASWSRIAGCLGVSKQAAHRKHRDVLAGTQTEDESEGPRILVSSEARRCVQLAREEARTLGAQAVGTEHLLLGILRSRRSDSVEALNALGVTTERARSELQATIVNGDPHPEAPGGEVPGGLGRRREITPHARRILEGALQEAVKLRDGFIGVEHLLLALLADRQNGAVRTLGVLGVTPAQVRRELERTWAEAAQRVSASAADGAAKASG